MGTRAAAAPSSNALNQMTTIIVFAIAMAMTSVMPVTPVAAHGGRGLKVGFYRHSCPHAESIVYNSIVESYRTDKTVAPGILRIAFHDCIVRGCDASVLLNGPNTERSAPFNRGLHGYDAVDAAKQAVERACPGIVSAADVVQFAARDSVILAGGHGWEVPAGRRDGTVSIMEEATIVNLPAPDQSVSDLLAAFRRKGLNAAQMVALSGAHTIGKAPCVTFDNRVQVHPVDPTLAPSFAASLKRQCPAPNMASTRVDMDSTFKKFDPQYFKDIIRGRGLLTSDQSLMYDARTKRDVHANAGAAFYRNFARAMVAMSKVEVLTGTSGEIRRRIGEVNHN